MIKRVNYFTLYRSQYKNFNTSSGYTQYESINSDIKKKRDFAQYQLRSNEGLYIRGKKETAFDKTVTVNILFCRATLMGGESTLMI